ncbi:glycosyltransferase family 50 protein [Peniophora sp. CONT]|nr:glycosyltransferase family 50 protein [Peniophora sp. CONT]
MAIKSSPFNFLRDRVSFGPILAISIALRVGLIVYSEWHDARSIVKYTDVDYRVFSDATQFLLHSGPGNSAEGPLGTQDLGNPYTRSTYRYTPLLAVLLSPNEWLLASFGKYLFAFCDILAGILIYRLVLQGGDSRVLNHASETSSQHEPRDGSRLDGYQRLKKANATLCAAAHLLSPFVFSISTRGSSESVLLLFVLGTLDCALRGRWMVAAVLLGLSAHWKIYPVVYGVSCVAALAGEQLVKGATKKYIRRALWDVASFTLVSASTFAALGVSMYAIWGQPFLEETYLYHVHRRDHRHNFAPHFYPTYLTYSGLDDGESVPLWRVLARSPLASFGPQMLLAVGAGAILARKRSNLVLAWFVQTFVFVLFNKVCTSQYFLWYLLFLPLLAPRLQISAGKGIACAAVWFATQALWLSQAYRLEFLGEEVYYNLWVCGVVYVSGNAWVLGAILDAYKGE